MRGAVTTGDHEIDLRIEERQAFLAVLSAFELLAKTPPDAAKLRNGRRSMMRQAKANWWARLRTMEKAPPSLTAPPAGRRHQQRTGE